MVPQNANVWSISREKSLAFQRKRALENRFLRTLLSSTDKFNPGCNRKMLNRKRTSILEEASSDYEQLFRPVRCTA